MCKCTDVPGDSACCIQLNTHYACTYPIPKLKGMYPLLLTLPVLKFPNKMSDVFLYALIVVAAL